MSNLKEVLIASNVEMGEYQKIGKTNAVFLKVEVEGKVYEIELKGREAVSFRMLKRMSDMPEKQDTAVLLRLMLTLGIAELMITFGHMLKEVMPKGGND